MAYIGALLRFEYVRTFDTFRGYKIQEKITGKKPHVITKTLIFYPGFGASVICSTVKKIQFYVST